MTHRPWFQIHLFTCIALMFTISILLGLNFYPRRMPFPTYEFPDSVIYKYGWPCEFRRLTTRNLDWEWNDVLANTIIAVLIVIVVGLVVEALARRRASKSL